MAYYPIVLLDTALQNRILGYLADGVSFQAAWKACGLGKNGYYDMLQVLRDGVMHSGNGDDPVPECTLHEVAIFVEKVEEALAQHEIEMIRVIKAKANAIGKEGDWRAAAFWLTHGASRKSWFEHKEERVVDVHVTAEKDQWQERTDARELNDAELLELADPAIAGLLAAHGP